MFLWRKSPFQTCICVRIVPAQCMADSSLAHIQWETSLQSNALSHWLGAKLELAVLWANMLKVCPCHYVIMYDVNFRVDNCAMFDKCLGSHSLSAIWHLKVKWRGCKFYSIPFEKDAEIVWPSNSALCYHSNDNETMITKTMMVISITIVTIMMLLIIITIIRGDIWEFV